MREKKELIEDMGQIDRKMDGFFLLEMHKTLQVFTEALVDIRDVLVDGLIEKPTKRHYEKE